MGRIPANFLLSFTGRSPTISKLFPISCCFSALIGPSLKSAIPPPMLKNSSNPDIHVMTSKINSYCRNRRLDDALQLFEKMHVRDLVAWNTMIKGCLDCGRLDVAETMFDEMPERSIVSWTTMINGYFHVGAVDLAVRFFVKMPAIDVTALNSMIHGYCINGKVDEALELFEKMPYRNVISWTSMISGLDQNGRSSEALRLSQQMMSCGVKPELSTLSCVIIACGNELAWKGGSQIHSLVMKFGYFLDEFITTSLITFYANCNRVEDFCRVFHEKKPHYNVVVWTSLLTAYSLNSKHENALKVFRDMIAIGVLPNQSTLTSALNACCDLEVLDRGKEVHAAAIKLGYLADAFVGNSLTVLYSKCGCIKDGIAAFTTIEEKNLVSWNSIIFGCAQHGCIMLVLALFAQMLRAKIEPDGFTLTGILHACSHSGIINKGKSFLQYFIHEKPAEIRSEHYASMVDIMGRCGELNEAEDFIQNMPIKADSMVWLALLSACQMHLNLEVAEKAANHIIDLDQCCSPAYILLSNLYASADKWGEVSRVRREMKRRGIMKQQGCSWFTLRREKHEILEIVG